MTKLLGHLCYNIFLGTVPRYFFTDCRNEISTCCTPVLKILYNLLYLIFGFLFGNNISIISFFENVDKGFGSFPITTNVSSDIGYLIQCIADRLWTLFVKVVRDFLWFPPIWKVDSVGLIGSIVNPKWWWCKL